jgi:hypothetical protein
MAIEMATGKLSAPDGTTGAGVQPGVELSPAAPPVEEAEPPAAPEH